MVVETVDLGVFATYGFELEAETRVSGARDACLQSSEQCLGGPWRFLMEGGIELPPWRRLLQYTCFDILKFGVPASYVEQPRCLGGAGL